MKSANEFRMIDEVYALCNEKQYFTMGDHQQYQRMFYMLNSEKFTVRDVAIAIWVCSESAALDEIETQLKTIWETVERDAEEEAREREMEALERHGVYYEYC